MSHATNSIIDGLVRYLQAASLAAVLLTLLVWLIIKAARVKAPVYSHMLWLCALVCVLTLPAIWLPGPRLTLAVLAPEPTLADAMTPQLHNDYDTGMERETLIPFDPAESVSAETITISNANPSPVHSRERLAGAWPHQENARAIVGQSAGGVPPP